MKRRRGHRRGREMGRIKRRRDHSQFVDGERSRIFLCPEDLTAPANALMETERVTNLVDCHQRLPQGTAEGRPERGKQLRMKLTNQLLLLQLELPLRV